MTTPSLPDEIRKLILDYGDAAFWCGEYQDDETAKFIEADAKRKAAFDKLCSRLAADRAATAPDVSNVVAVAPRVTPTPMGSLSVGHCGCSSWTNGLGGTGGYLCPSHRPAALTAPDNSLAAPEPALWVSPEQFEQHDPQTTGKSNYLPALKRSEGKFTMPLYAAPSVPPVGVGREAEHGSAAVGAGAAELPEPAACTIYVECRECISCGHVGINDDADQSACTQCDWSGPSPKEDHCPGCESDGTMTTACRECGCRSVLLASETLTIPAPLGAVAVDAAPQQNPDSVHQVGAPVGLSDAANGANP